MSQTRTLHSELGYAFEVTSDGSPTMRLRTGDGSLSESMHSFGGAFSETQFVYGAAFEHALASGLEPRALSIGLGLGYVELMCAAIAAAAGPGPASRLSGESHESVPELRQWFLAWLKGSDEVPEDFREAYDRILITTSAAYGMSADEIRETLASAERENRWLFKGAMDACIAFERPFSAVCFDAFSSKTSPDLWTEEFLGSFLERATAPSCVFSTYACTGTLKRSLARAGFELSARPGFKGKRESTFAVRSSL